jgi:chromosome segregation ATPase
MTDTTWSVRVPAELKEKIARLAEESGLTSKDLIADMVHVYELNRAQEMLPEIGSDIRELQGLTRRINAIFINIVQRMKTKEELMEKEWQERLLEKEAELEEQKDKTERFQRRIQELERENATLIAAKQETEKKLKDLNEVNTALKSLVREYEEKNNVLQAEVKKLSTYATENENLRGELTRIQEENRQQAAKIRELASEVEKLKLEKDRAVLIIRSEYEKRFNNLLEQKLEEYFKAQSKEK